MLQTTIKETLDCPIEEAWKLIGSYRNPEIYFSVIKSSKIEKEIGVGTIRYCTMQDGVVIGDRLEYLDNENHVLKYSIFDPSSMPIKSYLGTVTLRKLDEEKTEIEYHADFEADGVDDEQLTEMITGLLNNGIEGLKKLYHLHK